MTNTKSQCENCQQSLLNDARFCAACGQSAKSLHQPLFSVIADSLHEALDIDGRLMLTLKTLLFKPGRLSFDYNLGKRVKYTPPLRMYLVISILFFLILSQTNLTREVTEIYQEQTQSKLDAIYSVLPKLMFVLLPLFALILKILYRNTFYISNLIFAVHFHCFAYIILAILMPLESIEKIHALFMFMQFPIFIYLLYYLGKAIRLNYQQSWLKTISKTVVLVIVYMALVIMSVEWIQNNFSNPFILK